MAPHRIEEIINGATYRVTQIELLAVCNQHPVLHQVVQLLVDIDDEILRSGLQEQDLVVMVTVVRQVAALLANKLIMDDAEGNVRLLVVAADLMRLLFGRLAAGVDLRCFVAALFPFIP